MTQPSELLKALVLAEERAVGPSLEAATACWDSIVADLERGALPALDVAPPPAPPRHGLTWVMFTLVGVAALAVGIYSWRAEGEAPATSAPATTGRPEPSNVSEDAFSPPVHPLRESPSTIQHAASTPSAPDAAPAAPEQPREVVEPPPPASRSRRSTARVEAPKDTFAAELKLLAEGHAALNAGDAAEALRVAVLYEKTYPRGHFKEDREALRALALCAAGKGNAAARRFLGRNPRSIHVTRIREACALPADPDE